MNRKIRTIEVNRRQYRWTTRRRALSVASVNGGFAVRYPLSNIGNHYIHVTGSEFGGTDKAVLPSRYLKFPGFMEEVIITPRQVRELIEWCNTPRSWSAANPNRPQELITDGLRYQWLVVPIRFNRQPTLDFRAEDASIHLRQVLGQSEVLSLGERWKLYPSPQFHQGSSRVVLREDVRRLLAWWSDEKPEASADYPAVWPPGFRRFERRAEARGGTLDRAEPLLEYWQIGIFERTVRTHRGQVGGRALDSDTQEYETRSRAKRAAGVAIEAQRNCRFREISPEDAVERIRSTY